MSPTLKDKLQTLFFFDIITARKMESRTLTMLPLPIQSGFAKRVANKSNDLNPEEEYIQQAPFSPEFSEVIAINVGMFIQDISSDDLLIKVVAVKPVLEGEFGLILAFYNMVNAINARRTQTEGKEPVALATFNGKRFDVPFISKRSLINGLPIPEWLQTQGVKPWNYPILDIQDSWDFGGRGGDYTSLACIGYGFGLNVEAIIPYNTFDERYHQAKALGKIINLDEILDGSQVELIVTMQLTQKLLSIQ